MFNKESDRTLDIDFNIDHELQENDRNLNDSSNTVVGPDEFELDDLTTNGKQANARDTTANREEWVMLEDSNPIKGFFKKVWYGPKVASDDAPSFPYKYSITEKIEMFPEKVFRKRVPSFKVRISLLVVYCCIWGALLFPLLYSHLFKVPYLSSTDDSKIPIISLNCNSHLKWRGKNNMCGLNARDCTPFDNEEFFIRCPALCDRGGWTYSAVTVGEEKVKYTGYTIGGGELNGDDVLSYPYRADSFACGSAVHAGAVSPFFGGCAKVSMTGPQSSFPSRAGRYGTDWSVKFDTFFPASFTFKQLQYGIASGCYDPRALVVGINIFFGLPVFYLYEGAIGYWINAIVGYWTLVLSLDPPLLTDASDPNSVYELFSTGFQRLLPLCFLLYVLWKCAIKRTLEDGSPLAKVLCWYPTFWLGVMNNITFDRLPVDRLTIKDLKEQAGAFAAVGSIIATILTCAVIQAYSLWKSGRFRKYFKIYITIIGGLVFLGSIPGFTLRIHHYILGLMLVPGCATRGTSAYLFQGILLGLVLSGVGRWDFASILETNHSLLRGEAGDSLKPPLFEFNKDTFHAISWKLANVTDNSQAKMNGYSLLINDVERYVGDNTTINIDALLNENSDLSDLLEQSLEANDTVKLYLRVARASTDSPTKNHGDYTNAGVLEWPLGIWHEPKPGVT